MTTDLSSDFRSTIAARLRAAHLEIATRWLERLTALLAVGKDEIFPSDQVLDHVPALIREIADYIGEPGEAVAANTAIQSKAHELGELRFAQKATVHQLLREYRVLGAVISHFITEEVGRIGAPADAVDALAVASRLNEAVFVLLQITVDTFVGRYTERIEEQTARLEGFNRMVSHELRQPLSSVQYAVELLASDAAADPARHQQFLDVARRNTRRLGELVTMLGALVRPDHDSLDVQPVDLSKLVGEALRQLRESADARGVALRHVVEPAVVTIDPARLELVLINLVSNGIKYRDPSRPDPAVEVRAAHADGELRVVVRDNGLGIPDDDRDKVFRRFFRAHAARDAELGTEGTGLGLALVAECVKVMHGQIDLASAEGEGTTFTITLPTA